MTLKVNLAHHWLVGMRGGEKVLEKLGVLFPGSPIHTLVARPEKLSDALRRHPLHTSFLQRLPSGSSRYKSLLPLFPAALRRLSVPPDCDFLFSSDASVVKGLNYRDSLPHVCYCHSPPRYLWDLQDTYLQQTSALGALGRMALKAVTPSLRTFDFEAAQRVTHFIANSQFVRQRIQQHYRRDSAVIYPPVDVAAFDWQKPRGEFYLIVSELVAYKRIDIAIDAFNVLGKSLVIIGDGPERDALRRRANPNITFLGRQPFAVLKTHFESCRAFIYPQIEDFGITAVEAQASGGPVLAFRAGGAMETVLDGVTGLFFGEQSADALADCVQRREGVQFDPLESRQNAERFAPGRFLEEVRAFLLEKEPALFVDYSWPGW